MKKKLVRQIQAWFMLLVLLFSALDITAIAKVFAEDTDSSATTVVTTDRSSVVTPGVDETFDAEVSIFTEVKNPDGTQKLAYYTGEDIFPYAQFQISGTDVVVPNAKTVLTVPKLHVDERPKFTRSNTADSWVITEDDTNWYVTYSFSRLNGGQIVAVPFPFKMKQIETPNNFETPVKFELKDGNDQVLRSATTTFVAKVNPFTPVKTVNNSEHEYSISMTKTDRAIKSTENGIDIYSTNMYVEDVNQPNTPSDVEKAPYAQYIIGMHYEDAQYGKYAGHVKIVDKLPAGAVLQGTPNSSGQYVYSYNSQNFAWTYDAATHTATYEGSLKYNESRKQLEASLTLRYPNVPFANTHINRATLTVDPDTSHAETTAEVAVGTKWSPVPNPTAYGYSGNYKSGQRSNPEEGYIYRPGNNARDTFLTYSLATYSYNNAIINPNTSQKHISLLEKIDDYDLDDRLYYRRIKLNSISTKAKEQLTTDGYQVYGIKADGSEVKLGENMPVGEWLEIDDQTDVYDKLSIRFNKPIVLDGDSVYFYLDTNVKDAVWASWTPESVGSDDVPYNSPKRMPNTAKFYIRESWHAQDVVERVEKGNVFVRVDTQTVKSNNSDNYIVTYGDDNTRYLTSNAYVRGKAEGNREQNLYALKNVKQVTLLPAGISYVPQSKAISAAGAHKGIGEPQIVYNYKNTGKTAVIFDIGDAARTATNDLNIYVGFRVDIAAYTAEGKNVIEHFYTWDNNDTITAKAENGENWKKAYTDDLDLDNDGNTTEVFLRGTNTITFIPPREVIVKKFVSLDKTSWAVQSPYTEMDTPVYYRLELFNNSLVELRQASLLDVFPHKDDHKIVANEVGAYLPRESAFPVRLTEKLEDIPENAEVLKKFTVYYSTDDPGATLESERDANYVRADAITDITQVKMIKIVLNENEIVGVKESYAFTLKGLLPYDETLANFSAAQNSAAVSMNSVNYVEGNQVTSPIVHYRVDGILFADTNKNGQKDDDEKTLSGYKVQLLNEDGSVYTDKEGQPVTATTDTNGHYQMTVFKRGQYKVKVFKKDNSELFTTTYATAGTRLEKDNVIGNDTSQDPNDNAYGLTSSFALNPSNIPARTQETADEYEALLRRVDNTALVTRNIGLYTEIGSIKVTKTDADTKEALAGVTFELRKGDTVVTSKTTDDNGEVLFSDVIAGQYTLVETKALDGYVLDSTPIEVTIDADHLTFEEQLTNRKKRSTIVLTKQDTDTKEALAGVTFELRQGDTVVDTQVSDASGKITFNDVIYGQYTLVETATLDSHLLNSTPIDITVDTDGATIEKTVENQRKRSKIVLSKIDSQTGESLVGVTFALRQGNKEIASAVTNADGQMTFENVGYGQYTIVETKALEGYVLNSTPIDVNVTEDGATIEVGATNRKKHGNIRLVKTDAATQEKLAGVTFELRKGDTLIDFADTDDNGEVNFKNIPYGTYTLVETRTLTGYVLDSTPMTVEVLEDGVTVEKTMTNAQVNGRIVITKTDAETGAVLAGVTFELRQDDKVVDTAVTDDKGQAIFKDIAYGRYTIVETTALDGYVLDSTPLNVYVTDNTTIEQPMKNKQVRGRVALTKTDAETGALLAGVTFELRQGDKVIQTVETNDNGQALFENVAYGQYTLVETKALDGYVLNSNPIVVEITEADVTVEKEATNYKGKGRIVLTKTDAETGAVLAGVTFELRQGDKVIATAQTDDKGQVTFDKVAYGQYTLVETKALDGYELDSTPITVDVMNGTTVEKAMTNKKQAVQLGRIVLTKTDAETGTVLAGVTFELRQGDKVVATAQTDDKGQVTFDNVAYGQYTLVETKALDGYVLDNTPITVDVTDSATVEKTMTNKQIRGRIVLTKTDAETGAALAGVTFELRQGDKVIQTVETDDNGQALFENVAYGQYTLVETKALAGYVLDNTPITVDVTDGTTVEKAMTNKRVPSVPPTVPSKPTPNKPSQPKVPNTPPSEVVPPKNKELPKTGVQEQSAIVVFGMMFVMLAYVLNKKQN